MTQLDYVVVDPPNVLPMDVALHRAAEHFNIEITLTGGSGFGWSRYSTLQACPYRYYLRYVRKTSVLPDNARKPKALEIGGGFHAFMALYYQRIVEIEKGIPADALTADPGVVCDFILDAGADAALVNEAWRLFDAYANYYEMIDDYIKPLAVEHWIKDPNGPGTARIDLLAAVREGGALKVLPGTYIVEHKSAARLDEATTEGWHLDGEILGLIDLYKRARLAQRFGKLQGVIVNIVTKTKIPGFHREIVAPPDSQARRQHKDLKTWNATLGLYKATNTWPRALNSCWGRYGACDYVAHCRGD